MPLLQSLLIKHIIPSVFDAVVTLLLVLAILNIFSIKRPSTRFIFLFLPLLKPFLVLIDNGTWKVSKPNFIHTNSHYFRWGVRMPDPLSLILSPWKETAQYTYDNSAVTMIITAVIIAVLLVIVVRWAQLFLFVNSFKKEKRLNRADYPQIYEILSDLARKFGIKPPELVLTNNYQFVPFSVGYKKPIIVITKDLIDSFPLEQLEIMLAHELAHIRRNDNFTSWISLVLRDLMFFNPLVHAAYRMVEEEKEHICDRLANEKADLPVKAIANTLLDVAIFRKRLETQQKPSYPALAKGFLYKQSTLQRRIEAISTYKPAKQQSKLHRFFIGFVFFVLLYMQPYIALALNSNNILFLR